MSNCTKCGKELVEYQSTSNDSSIKEAFYSVAEAHGNYMAYYVPFQPGPPSELCLDCMRYLKTSSE